MKIKRILFFCFSISCMYSSCVKSFAPEIDRYDELLVVDGWLTDTPGPYVIQLSISSQLKQLVRYIPYGGCELTITDDAGNTFPLVESKTGVYLTDSATCRGIAGRSYTLKIKTQNGDEVESMQEQLLAPIEIDRVYAEVEH